nr:MAG TPA: hypothetical protein [Caudoviricetes sp.]
MAIVPRLPLLRGVVGFLRGFCCLLRHRFIFAVIYYGAIC